MEHTLTSKKTAWLVQYPILHAAQNNSVLSACGMTHVAQTPLLSDVTCPQCLTAMVKKMAALEPKETITLAELLSYPDGTWIMTNHEITKVLDTARWTEPKPSGFLNGFWWRRKQLMDQLGMVA